MRTAFLTTALMMVATMAWADEPTAPAPQPAATATQTKPAEPATPATEAATTSQAATASTAAADAKTPLRPPQGYRPKRVNGEQVWCAKLVVLGSRFPKEDCRNEAELRELIRTRESMRTDMEQRLRTCTSNNGGCGMN
jgi:hypothetical protein